MSRARFDARFEWGPHGVRTLAPEADVLVLVDVLSFTTAVDVAVAAGATVVPHRWHTEPAAAAGDLVAVGRSSVDDAHPWSLSPASLRALPPGSRLVLPSPNGSALAAGAAAHGARTVVAGCLRNASAVGAAARRLGGTLAVVAAGERWHGSTGPLRPAVEDLLGAGAVLAAARPASPSPEARAAIAAFQALRDDLPAVLAESTSGRELAGWPDDLRLAAELDASTSVPVLRDGAFTRLGTHTAAERP